MSIQITFRRAEGKRTSKRHAARQSRVLKIGCSGGGPIATLPPSSAQVRGVFPESELHSLFATIPRPRGDLQGYGVLLLAATCGLRRGEVLALRWRHLDLEKTLPGVEEARKYRISTGGLKWGQVHAVRLTPGTVVPIKMTALRFFLLFEVIRESFERIVV